jgi:hypothetical protein
MIEEDLKAIKEKVLRERKIFNDFNSLTDSSKKTKDEREKRLIDIQAERLKNSLKNINDELLKNIAVISIQTPLTKTEIRIPEQTIKLPEKITKPNVKQEIAHKWGVSSQRKKSF